MYKQNFEEILENVQQQILSHFGVTEEDLEAATEAFKDDPEIAKLVTELETLYLGKRETKEKEEEEGVYYISLLFTYTHTHIR